MDKFAGKEEEFILEYFKQVRGELTARVQIHTNLILQKVATCGAALGFLFNQKSTSESLVSPEVQLLGFALIPIIAMGYDVLIARNINNLHRLGTFIRNEIEPLSSMKVKLWERKYGQPDQTNPKNHGVVEINFLSLFTLATEITATVIYLNKQPSYLWTMVVLFALHAFVFLFMRQQILEFDTFEDEQG
jgi:hypothetical protein